MIFHVILYTCILTIQCHCPEICGSYDVMKELLVVKFFFLLYHCLTKKVRMGDAISDCLNNLLLVHRIDDQVVWAQTLAGAICTCGRYTYM